MNDIRNSSQHQQSSSKQKTTTASTPAARTNKTTPPTTSSAATTSNSSQQQSARRSTIVPPTSTSVPVASTFTSASSRDKRLEAIRERMDSCLTAITNKVSDKAQRSPHGPFLSYLGTKLPSVPKEMVQKLEREILDLVEHYSL